jgi:predicted branched-subunit amino acid permease
MRATAGATWDQTRREIVRNALSIGLAVATYGVSFGALGTTTGLSIAQTCALSVLMFTGGSQFALVSTLASGGTGLSGGLAAVLLGTRNTAYSMRMNPIINAKGPMKLLASHLTIDESTAMGLAQDEKSFSGNASRLAFWSTGLSVFVLWNIATLVGALAATTIGDPKTLGLDAAIGAGLFALVYPQIQDRRRLVIALGGALIALSLANFVTPGVPIISASIVAFIGGYIFTTRGSVRS